MTEKVTRAAFIYLEPKLRDDKETFAQCWSCRMFVPEVEGLKGGRCIIHGSKVEVSLGATCGFYVDWPTPKGECDPAVVKAHAEELAGGIAASVTPEESGLINEKVQCRRCVFGENNATICAFFRALNLRAPSVSDFDTKIKPNACCNAWTEKPEEYGKRETKALQKAKKS